MGKGARDFGHQRMIKLVKIIYDVFRSQHVKKHAEVIFRFLLASCIISMLNYVCFMDRVSLVIHHIY